MVSEEAEEYKKKGNDAFKERNWDEAIKQYNKAIALDPENAAYYSNRSGAWSSKGKHESALADANKCLEKDPNFVKGYARKGKALFDMDKWEEAETAYNDGLRVDSANEGCKRGIADIIATRQRVRSNSSSSSSSSSSSGAGVFGGAAGFVPKLVEKLKKGGRMQSYLVIVLAYYAFTSFTGRSSKKSGSDHSESTESVDYEDDEANQGMPRELGRHFMETNNVWVSYLQSQGKADSTLMLVHRTALSADAEYGTLLPQLSGLHILAPDRPCHGYSTCPSSGEPVNGSTWLNSILTVRSPPKRLGLVATGRTAAEHVLALARRRRTAVHVWLLAPNVADPEVGTMSTGAELQVWLKEQWSAATPQGAADAAHWAARGGAARPRASLSAGGLPKGSTVTVLYGDDEKEDEELATSLEAKGVKVRVRNVRTGESVHEGLVDEVQQAMGETDSTEADGD